MRDSELNGDKTVQIVSRDDAQERVLSAETLGNEIVESGNEDAPRPKLSLVIPTRNEAVGIEELLQHLSSTMDAPTEIVFVDDSDDATPWSVRRLTDDRTWGNLSIRLVHRTENRRRGGLGSAVCEGLRRASGEWVCVLDADLQHPPEVVLDLLKTAEEESVDVVVASRHLATGRDEGLSPSRRLVSKGCAVAAKSIFPLRLRKVSDPLSGFFLVRRDAIDPDQLRPHGFKILLEILGRNPKLKVAEVGYVFGERYAGVSKASVREGLRYFWQLGHIRSTALAHQTTGPFNYDVHGILTVQSDAHLPELHKFRTRQLDGEPDVRVHLKRFERRGAGELIDLSEASARIRYDETFGQNGFAIEVEVGDPIDIWVSPSIVRSPHVLYTNVVEPILRWQFVERGFALVHAACFTDGDDAHLVTARTDTGKTTTMLKILELGRYGFLSDDLTLIDDEGRVYTYPKPLTISNHTVHALASAELGRLERLTLPLQSRLHSKGGRTFALYLAEKDIPVATLNAFVQRVIPPPKYHVEQLVPGAPTSLSAAVATLNIIQRGEDHRQDLDLDEALEILLENCEDAYGFPPYSALEALLHTCSTDDLRFKERAIISAGLRKAEARLFSSSSMGWAKTIHDEVVRPRLIKRSALNGQAAS